MIARHRRSYDSEDLIFDPLHYLPLIEQKIRPHQAAPAAGWDLPEAFITLAAPRSSYGQGRQARVRPGAPSTETFRLEEVDSSVGDALRLGAIGFDVVKHLVLCRIERRPPRLNLDVYGRICRAPGSRSSAKSYMSLLSGLGHDRHTASAARPPPQKAEAPTWRSTRSPSRALEGVARPLLLRLFFEPADRPRARMVERRIKAARFPVVKSLDILRLQGVPSLNKALV